MLTALQIIYYCAAKKLDDKKLSNPRNVVALQEALAVNLEVTTSTNCPEESWSALRGTVYNTASDILDHAKRKHQDWFDENDEKKLKETREAKAAWLSNRLSVSKHERFKRLRRESQEKIRHIKDSWWKAKAEELQHYADQHASKQFFEGLRTVYGPPSSTVTPIRDYEGYLPTAKASIPERWAEHFKTLLNRPSIIQDQVIDDIPQRSLINFLNECPTLAEAKKAVDQLQSGKAQDQMASPPRFSNLGVMLF